MTTRALVAPAFVVALTLRLLHLRAIVPFELGAPPAIGMDRWLATHVAAAVADGRWLGGWAAAYDSSPGYSYLLAGLYRLGGGSWLVPLALQAILGACTPILLYGVARELLSRPTAVLAAWLAALYTPAIFYEGLLVKFALVPVTVAGSLLALARARTRAAAGWAVVGGLGLGLLTVLRPNAAAAVPPLVAWLAWSPGRSWGRAARLVVGTGIGLALALGPMGIRDALAARGGLASSLWGLHFYIGANPAADGGYASVPGVREDVVGHIVDARTIAERAAGGPLAPSAVSAYWARRGLAFITAEPGHYVAIEVRKLARTFAADETGSFGDDFHDQRARSFVLALPLVTFATIAPLGFLGLGLSAGRRRGTLLAVYVTAFTFSLLPFFVEGRYRLALVPALIVLAAEALTALAGSSRRRLVLPLAGAGLLVVGAALGARPGDLLVLVVVLGAGTATASTLAQSPT